MYGCVAYCGVNNRIEFLDISRVFLQETFHPRAIIGSIRKIRARSEFLDNGGFHFGVMVANVPRMHIRFKNSDLSAQVYRSLFDVARQYRESFEVYGSQKSVEWPLIEHRPLVIHTAKKPEPEIPEEVTCPDFGHLLPPEIAPFTQGGVYGGEDGEEHLSFTQGAGHGGSHPHLVHAFVGSLDEGRTPPVDAHAAARITAPGICAHESAMAGGEPIEVPAY